MKKDNRRTFIKQSSMAMAAIALHNPLLALAGKQQAKLAFSTLGCPAWSLSTIVKFAAQHGYHGVEIRIIQGEMDLTKCPDFSPANISSTKRMFADNNLIITDLGSSASLHHVDKALRQKNLDEGKRYTDLAQKLESPYIRVLPDKLPANEDPQATLNIIADGLNELALYAKNSNVEILLETHGDVAKTDDLVYIMEKTSANGVGLVWDILNAWAVTKEPPSEVYKALKQYIKHVHVKDGKFINGKIHYVLLGKGEAPLKEPIKLMHKDNYKGFYSFEWEKRWHPELEEPEIALAHYPTEIKKYF